MRPALVFFAQILTILVIPYHSVHCMRIKIGRTNIKQVESQTFRQFRVAHTSCTMGSCHALFIRLYFHADTRFERQNRSNIIKKRIPSNNFDHVTCFNIRIERRASACRCILKIHFHEAFTIRLISVS